MKLLFRLSILLLLTVLIVLPPSLAGYQNLVQARSGLDASMASRYYESAAKLLFWQPNLYEEAGMLEMNDPRRAIRLLTRAKDKSALTASGQIGLGDAYQASGEPARALTEWEDLLARKEQVPAASLRLAKIYHTAQNFESEQRVLILWLEADPNNAQASESLGLILAASATPRAISLLESASANSPDAATRLKQLISALKPAAEQPVYRLTLCGQALAQMGEWPLAGQAFNMAVQTDPLYASAWAWLGLARQKNGAPDALPALEKAVQLETGSAPLRAMLGTYWLQAGENQKAHLEFEKATEIEPGNPAWWQGLAASDAQVNLPEALKSYVQAVNLDPQNAANWFALAAFCMEKNAFVEEYGVSAALRAYALVPQNPLYMDMLGRAQMATGQWQAAEVMFKKALASGAPEQTPGFHFHLGLLYLQTKREALAKNELKITLEADPQGQYGAQAKMLLERYYP